MSDPYRSAPSWSCPRCTKPILPADLEVACEWGCGSWMPVSALTAFDDISGIGEPDRTPWWKGSEPQVKCAVCQSELAIRSVGKSWIYVCATHGVWIDPQGRVAFHELHQHLRARQQRLAELVVLLIEGDPSTMRVIADRMITLEDRVEELADEIHKLKLHTGL